MWSAERRSATVLRKATNVYRDTRVTVGILLGSSSRNWGLMRTSCQRTPKNKCGPVARPVDPTRPSISTCIHRCSRRTCIITRRPTAALWAGRPASRIFITCDDFGKGRLNTSYFLGVLTSVAIHTAYRPYWARSASATFNNFGSTIGSDAGMNVFHEFEPVMRQMVKGHAPRFVLRIEERISPDQHPTQVVFSSA